MRSLFQNKISDLMKSGEFTIMLKKYGIAPEQDLGKPISIEINKRQQQQN